MQSIIRLTIIKPPTVPCVGCGKPIRRGCYRDICTNEKYCFRCVDSGEVMPR